MARPFNPYASIRRTEPDLRKELNNMFDGIFPEIAKKQTMVLRKFRRDSNGKLIPCDCVDPTTREPDKDTYCPFCQGEGAYWDEGYMDGYKVLQQSSDGLGERITAPGLMNIPVMVFYTRSSVDLTEDDKLVVIALDTEGNPVVPLRRVQLYRIGNLVDYRSDNGRLEYWKISCYGEQRKFLNGPGI
jgi:hypothetical protein